MLYLKFKILFLKLESRINSMLHFWGLRIKQTKNNLQRLNNTLILSNLSCNNLGRAFFSPAWLMSQSKVHEEMINQVWCGPEPRGTSLGWIGTPTVSQAQSPNQASSSSSDSINYFIMDFALCASVILERKKTLPKLLQQNSVMCAVAEDCAICKLFNQEEAFHILLIILFYNM